jgi:hypothetical protein
MDKAEVERIFREGLPRHCMVGPCAYVNDKEYLLYYQKFLENELLIVYYHDDYVIPRKIFFKYSDIDTLEVR